MHVCVCVCDVQGMILISVMHVLIHCGGVYVCVCVCVCVCVFLYNTLSKLFLIGLCST